MYICNAGTHSFVVKVLQQTNKLKIKSLTFCTIADAISVMLQPALGIFTCWDFSAEFSPEPTLGVSLTFGTLTFSVPLSQPIPLEDFDQVDDNEDELLSDPETGDKDRLLAQVWADRFVSLIVLFGFGEVNPGTGIFCPIFVLLFCDFNESFDEQLLSESESGAREKLFTPNTGEFSLLTNFGGGGVNLMLGAFIFRRVMHKFLLDDDDDDDDEDEPLSEPETGESDRLRFLVSLISMWMLGIELVGFGAEFEVVFDIVHVRVKVTVEPSFAAFCNKPDTLSSTIRFTVSSLSSRTCCWLSVRVTLTADCCGFRLNPGSCFSLIL